MVRIRKGRRSRRPLTPAERAADAAATRERLRQTSPTISEAFPGVRSIAFKVHFTDFDGTPLKTEWIFTRTDRDNAFFQRACIASSPVTWADPRRCEGGGFDFRHAV